MVSLTHRQARRSGQHGERHREREKSQEDGRKGTCGVNRDRWDGAGSTGMLSGSSGVVRYFVLSVWLHWRC